ncbi:energy transducer TonB [Azomonas macrocytogenes]|uniref:Protein TonB n=1 Tax=Azomonas macrocytogenes TaxID=69962 RepID=A0A839T4A5_AZOMA|nr:energy transducer TonB [Azomonas macrocytogenes]MBB3103829.1 protein TonB [Azomonas macrocytogenes]
MSSNSRKIPLWGISLLLVLSLHIGIVAWSLFWRAKPPPIELPPAAPMMVQLEPLPPPPPPPQAQQVEPEPIPDPEPKLVEAPDPKLAVAKTEPKPKPKPKPKKEKPKKPDQEKKVAQKPVESPDKKDSPMESQVAQSSTTDANSRTTSAASTASSNAKQDGMSSSTQQVKASWQSLLLSHLARYKIYPEEAKRRERPGVKVNRLRFTIDGEGRVLSYELVGRSGNPLLDRATLEMIRKAQPLPPPPPELLNDGTLEIVAPLAYELKRSS